ncbi:MAG TPA: PHP domain-containing protein, partial [Candidatus Acidoferrales bacterium]|nr:PHP domain-containing protein [Candidatus Acidoferrales bacterium]
MLRADLHHHFNADPVDKFVQHSIGELIDRAASIGLNVLAVTCHEAIPYDDDAVRYAAEKGIILLRGMEATVGGGHVLLINFPEFPGGVCTMAEIAAAKGPDSLVISPHPFYPTIEAAAQALIDNSEVFDAVEFSGMYSALTRRFNRQAVEFARSAELPVVGNSDTHFLWQMGHTYTWIDA